MATRKLPAPWKILLLDVERSHQLLVNETLKGFSFQNQPIHLLIANSIHEAQEKIERENEIAIILCNATVYAQVAILQFLNYVRQRLNNESTRWILILDETDIPPPESLILEHSFDGIISNLDLPKKQIIQTTIILAFKRYLECRPQPQPSHQVREQTQSLQINLAPTKTVPKTNPISQHQSSHHQLLNIIENISDGILIVNQAGEIRFANATALRLFNQPLKKLINFELGVPILSDQATEISIVKAPRVIGNVEMNVSMTEWENESMYILSLRDIDERQKTEQNLRDSESKFRQLADHVQEVFLLTSPQTRNLIYINHACESIWGWSVQELYLQPYLLINAIYAGDRPKVMEALLQQRQGKSTDIEYRITRADQTIRWVREKAFPIQNEKHDVYRVAAVITDITEEKSIQEKLAQQALIFQCISDGVIVFNLTGEIIDWNPGAEAMFGYSKQDVLGKNTDFIYQCNNESYAFSDILNQIFISGTEVKELNVHRKDKSIGICEVRFLYLKEITGQPVAIVSLNRDITERKKSEEELIQAKQIADAANRIKSEFLANMSHEIRTPMNGVIGMTDLLLKTPLTEEQQDLVQTIERSSDSLLHIINDILDFSKIESGKLNLDPIIFDLPQEIHSILSLFQLQANQKQVQLIYNGDRLTTPYIVGDITRIRQVLMNLLGNALKFTDEGNVTLEVSNQILENGSNQQQLFFVIRDTGIGIQPDQQKELFQPFSQLDNSITRNYGGTGLGLAICKRLVEMMGGTIWVKSEVGIGSTFHFVINIETATEMPLVLPEENAQNTRLVQQRDRHLKILLAEDNDVNIKVAQLILKRLGYSATIAKNGAEVVAILQQQHYDVILMDVQMPEMDGLEATKWIRQNLKQEEQPYIIAMTAHAMKGDDQICLEAGMDSYLSKPIRVEKLKIALDQVTLNQLKFIDAN